MMKNNTNKSPFTLVRANPNKHFTLCIALDGEVIHHIPNLMSFIRHLGYPDIAHQVIDTFPEVTKNQSVFNKLKPIDFNEHVDFKSDNCLQYKIKEYLFQNSKLYREQCSERYAKLIGSCNSLKKENSKKCDECVMLKK